MSETRYFEKLPSAGELVLSRDPFGGLRHFLDGRPIELGTMIRFLGTVPGDGSTFFSRARAALVRYESRLDGVHAGVLLVFQDGTERLARAEDRFEWPAKKSRTTTPKAIERQSDA